MSPFIALSASLIYFFCTVFFYGFVVLVGDIDSWVFKLRLIADGTSGVLMLVINSRFGAGLALYIDSFTLSIC